MTGVRDLSDQYLRCRLFGHSWDDIPAPMPKKRPTVPGQREAFRCARCQTVRIEVWSRGTGQLLYKMYEYPEGYHMTRDEMVRDTWRLEYIRRQDRQKRAKRKEQT